MVMMTSLSSTTAATVVNNSERMVVHKSAAVNGPQPTQQQVSAAPPIGQQQPLNQSSQQTAATPQLVGREFVRQYYTMMGEAPKLVYRFYSNDSIYVFNGGEPVVGQANISDRIESLSLKDCHTKIRAVDAHETVNRGVVVQVIGEISVNAGPSRRFAQTFVLAPQSEKKYYVHNDTFRYLDELFDENATVVHDTDTPSLTESIVVSTMVRSVGVATVNGTVHDEDLENRDQQQQQVPLTQQQRIISPIPPSFAGQQPLPPRSGLSVMNALGRYAASATVVTDAPSTMPSSGDAVMTFEPSAAADWSISAQQDQQQPQPPPHHVVMTSSAPVSQSQHQQQQAVTHHHQFHQPSSHRHQHYVDQSGGPMLQQQQQVMVNSGGGLLSPTENSCSLVDDQPARPTSAGKESSTCPSEEPEEQASAPAYPSSWAHRVAGGGSAKKPASSIGGMTVSAGQGRIIKNSQSPPVSNTQMSSAAPAVHQSLATSAISSSQQAPPPGPVMMQQQMSGGPQQPGSRASPAPSFSGGSNGKVYQGPGSGGRYLDGKSLECQIFVSNLPENAKEEELRDYFKTFGQIYDLKLHLRAKTQPNRPFPAFAFLTFADVDTARKVLTADKSLHRIRGNHALVVEQKRDEPHVRGGGARNERDRGMSAGGGTRSGGGGRGSGRPYRGGGGGSSRGSGGNLGGSRIFARNTSYSGGGGGGGIGNSGGTGPSGTSSSSNGQFPQQNTVPAKS